MDWSNERYVRLYTRDTPEWLCLPWEARALWPLLLRKVDRAGVIATKLGVRGVAVLAGLPNLVAEVGMAALIEDGCVRTHALGFVVPNFLVAQEATAGGAERQRRHREKRRDLIASLNNNEASQDESHRHDESRAPLHSNEQSHETSRVTPSLPSLPNRAREREGGLPATPASLSRPVSSVLPDGFNPGPEAVAIAQQRGLDLTHELEQFRSHSADKGHKSADWNAKFTKWLRGSRDTDRGASTRTLSPDPVPGPGEPLVRYDRSVLYVDTFQRVVDGRDTGLVLRLPDGSYVPTTAEERDAADRALRARRQAEREAQQAQASTPATRSA